MRFHSRFTLRFTVSFSMGLIAITSVGFWASPCGNDLFLPWCTEHLERVYE